MSQSTSTTEDPATATIAATRGPYTAQDEYEEERLDKILQNELEAGRENKAASAQTTRKPFGPWAQILVALVVILIIIGLSWLFTVIFSDPTKIGSTNLAMTQHLDVTAVVAPSPTAIRAQLNHRSPNAVEKEPDGSSTALVWKNIPTPLVQLTINSFRSSTPLQFEGIYARAQPGLVFENIDDVTVRNKKGQIVPGGLMRQGRTPYYVDAAALGRAQQIPLAAIPATSTQGDDGSQDQEASQSPFPSPIFAFHPPNSATSANPLNPPAQPAPHIPPHYGGLSVLMPFT